MRFFATTVTGLEDVAAAEISRLLGVDVVTDVSKVFFDASPEGCALLNYSAKSVNKVYLLVARGEATGLAEIEGLAAAPSLVELIDRGQSFAVRAERHGEHDFTSLDIAAAVGEAIIESYKSATGVRLRVDLNDPDVEFLAILRDSDFILGLNTTGLSLHHRYYRVRHHRAGLSPTVAYSMLMIAGWQPSESLLDPFCGSGTIPIEAAIHALNIHPGIRMENLAMTRLRIFSPAMLRQLKERLMSEEESPKPLDIAGIDASPKALADAETNLEMAGLKGCVNLSLGDALNLEKFIKKPFSKIVCNPPFGVRMGLRDPYSFYTKAFSSMRRASPGASLTLIASKPVVVARALEDVGWTVTGERRIMLGSIAAHIIKAEQ